MAMVTRDGLIIFGASLTSDLADDSFVSDGRRELYCNRLMLNRIIGAISIYGNDCVLIDKYEDDNDNNDACLSDDGRSRIWLDIVYKCNGSDDILKNINKFKDINKITQYIWTN